jgi:hypothetical protein
LTEGGFAIALAKRVALLDSKAYKEAKRIATKDRGKPIGLGPYTVFMITKHNKSRLSMEREEIFIFLICQDAHSGICFWSAFLMKRLVLPESDFTVSGMTFSALLFLIIALEPNLLSRMHSSQGLKK